VTLEDGQLAMDQQNANGTLSHRSDKDILASGGCNYHATGEVFDNGHEWHPKVHSHGEVKCVICRCKVSYMTCKTYKWQSKRNNFYYNLLPQGYMF